MKKEGAKPPPNIDYLFRAIKKPGVTADEAYGLAKKEPPATNLSERILVARKNVAHVLRSLGGVNEVRSLPEDDPNKWNADLYIGLDPVILRLSITSVSVLVKLTGKQVDRHLHFMQIQGNVDRKIIYEELRRERRIILAGEQDGNGIESHFLKELTNIDNYHKAHVQQPNS